MCITNFKNIPEEYIAYYTNYSNNLESINDPTNDKPIDRASYLPLIYLLKNILIYFEENNIEINRDELRRNLPFGRGDTDLVWCSILEFVEHNIQEIEKGKRFYSPSICSMKQNLRYAFETLEEHYKDKLKSKKKCFFIPVVKSRDLRTLAELNARYSFAELGRKNKSSLNLFE